MTSFLDVIAADDSAQRLASRKAVVVAQTRVQAQFGDFIDQYGQQALDYAAEDIRGVVTAAAEEYNGDADKTYDTVMDYFSDRIKQPEAKTASVHESRKTKMCPFHKDIVDISLAQGEPQAGFSAMAQHWGGPRHCEGEGYEGDKCNFKPAMTTQSYWDERKEKAEQRKQDREQAAELEAQQPTDEQIEEVVDEAPATTEEFDDASLPDNVIEVDFGGDSEAAEPTSEAPDLAVAAKIAAALVCKACGHTNVNPKHQCENCGSPLIEDPKTSKTSSPTTGLGDPVSPTIDKRVWRPKEINTEGDDSPVPTKRKDIVEPIKPNNTDRITEIGENTTERQDVNKDSNPSADGAGTQTWTEGPKTAISKVADAGQYGPVQTHPHNPSAQDTPRTIEMLPNGKWRVDWQSGLTSTYDQDPRPVLGQGIDPAAQQQQAPGGFLSSVEIQSALAHRAR